VQVENHDQQVGVDIIRRALQAPARQIAANAGYDGAVVAGKILESKDTNFGFDAQEGEYKDLVKGGIVDPTKVVRVALEDAASVAGLLVGTEAIVAEAARKPRLSINADAGGIGEADY
jgi:chaperonin GroEL